jgi:hypothetical protein
MTATNPQSHEIDEAIRKRILERATAINTKLVARFSTAAEDLEAGGYLAALGSLDGIEKQIDTMRSLLLLLR